MRLRSIPPANRSLKRGNRLSSMRAATRTGFTFVGGRVGSASQQQPTESQFTPRVIAPNPEVVEMRRRYRVAVADLAGKFETLRQSAEDVVEKDFWQEALTRLQF